VSEGVIGAIPVALSFFVLEGIARMTQFGIHQHQRAIVDALLHEAQTASETPETDVELPRVVMNNRPLRAITADVVNVLTQTNDPPVLFVQSGRVVRLRRDERGQTWIEPVTHYILRRRLTQVADVVHESGDGERRWHVFPSRSVLLDVLAMDAWSFPPLEGIVETPILRPEGTILDSPGYDSATRLIYMPPSNFRLLPIPEHPSSNDVAAALALIEEPLEGFPFVDDAAKANTLALLITPILRHAINSPVPLALIDAPQAGTGKTLLARVMTMISAGQPAAMMPAPSGDEEWRKRITATLSAGATLIVIDNVEGAISAPSLAAALTTDVWRDRLLGASEMLTLPNRATWLATGNNIRPGGDLPRRCYWIRLDAKTSRPWQRTGFRYPDLLGWVADHRRDYVSALLLLARAWYAAGQPEADVPTLGSFEAWSRTIGGILHHAGVPGFLSNLEAMYAEADDGAGQWEAFLKEWLQQYGDRRLATAELAEALLQPGDNPLREALPDELAEMLPTREGEEGKFRRRLGHAFRKRVEQRFGEDDLFLARAGDDTHRKVALWRVIMGRGSAGRAGSVPSELQRDSQMQKGNTGAPNETPLSPQPPRSTGPDDVHSEPPEASAEESGHQLRLTDDPPGYPCES
jgi:hypothetical protein